MTYSYRHLLSSYNYSPTHLQNAAATPVKRCGSTWREPGVLIRSNEPRRISGQKPRPDARNHTARLQGLMTDAVGDSGVM